MILTSTTSKEQIIRGQTVSHDTAWPQYLLKGMMP